MSKTLFITGAGGYIGTEMVNYFLNKGYKVKALDRFYFGDTLDDLKSNSNLELIKDDIRFFDKKHLKKVDVVIDLASISNDPASDLLPKITEDINYRGAVRIAKLAKEMGVKKHIFSSSCSIYGAGDGILTEESEKAPISIYAKCKIKAEKDLNQLANDSFSVTHMRNATVYGISQRRMRFDLIINIMTLNAWNNNKIHVLGGGKQWRPLVHVIDLIRAFEAVILENNISKINKEAFNVGSNEQNFQVYQVARFYRAFFANINIETIPADPDRRNYHVCFDKINNVLGFKCEKTIDDGIEEIIIGLRTGKIEESIKTSTVKYYKYLLEANEILKTIKINNKILSS